MPENKEVTLCRRRVQVFVLTDGYDKAADFGEASDKLSVNILDDCVIDLSRVFSE